MNAKTIRQTGLKDCIRKINGKTVRGFWLDIKDYTVDNAQQIYETTHPKKDVAHPVNLMDQGIIEKKIRFLMRDWDDLPQWVKMDYKQHKDNYLKEVAMNAPHKMGWFYDILMDLHNSGNLFGWPGKDIDFVLRPSTDIMRELIDSGVAQKAKRADMDKILCILKENGFVRINDYVHGKLIVFNLGEGIPDWLS